MKCPDIKLKDRLSAACFTLMLKATGSLPWRMLYLLADFLAWLAHSVVRYRRKVVYANLRSSFPEKSDREIAGITRRFYRHLADYFVETARLSVMSLDDVRRHLRYENLSLIDEDTRAGRDVTLLLGHYGNWEWISTIPSFSSNTTGVEMGQIYHPLENRGADLAFLKMRERFGATCVSMASTIRVILGWRNEGKRSVVGYIADQSPMADDTHLWVDFLNHDTPVFTGAERIARKLRGPVYYLDLRKERRGHYVASFVRICEDASAEKMFEPTREYYRLLENTIRRAPEYWLWSHRRWKRTRADFEARWGESASQRLNRL